MNILVLFVLLLIGVSGPFTGTQARARDTERKTDINALHVHLETFYAENGYYPTTETFNSEADALLKGLDREALVDPDGNRINTGGDYAYNASDCAVNQCQDYDLASDLEAEDRYIKSSLN